MKDRIELFPWHLFRIAPSRDDPPNFVNRRRRKRRDWKWKGGDPWRFLATRKRRKGGGGRPGSQRHFANWNGTGRRRRRVFFSPFNRNTQRVYPRVAGAPGKKRNWRVYKRQGNIARCRRAKIYCRGWLLSSGPKAARTAAAARMDGKKEGGREGKWRWGGDVCLRGMDGRSGEWAIEEKEQWGGWRDLIIDREEESESKSEECSSSKPEEGRFEERGKD